MPKSAMAFTIAVKVLGQAVASKTLPLTTETSVGKLMDVVITYLYGDLDTTKYMKVPEELPLTSSNSYRSRNMSHPGLGGTISLASLHHRSTILSALGPNHALTVLFLGTHTRTSQWVTHPGSALVRYSLNFGVPIEPETSELPKCLVLVYVDDMNLIGTPIELEEIAKHLKSEFEMKELRKTRYCLSLEIQHCSNRILVHQSNYTYKVLHHFNEDKAKSSTTLMVVRTLDAKRYPFRLKEDKEKILEPEVPYLSAIGALLYWFNALDSTFPCKFIG
ncbi:S ribonuclease [Pyrus ussuriensis x Pyrus communis]|uniref:S ribonuclease n=1 Tax=Pyrus ussuriensis x Pyrus communis TaxID=2448454 RepID=A0A5N5FEX9_9ROSA|nr:S ribonuclease [Pyrus ussuriensis x Pyrus communis]